MHQKSLYIRANYPLLNRQAQPKMKFRSKPRTKKRTTLLDPKRPFQILLVLHSFAWAKSSMGVEN